MALNPDVWNFLAGNAVKIHAQEPMFIPSFP